MAVASELTRLGPGELADRLKNENAIRVVDVRSPTEHESAHLPGSHNLPLDLLPAHAAMLGERIDAPFVLVCHSDQRARQAEGILVFITLRGPKALTGGASAVGETPGMAVLLVDQGGASGKQVAFPDRPPESRVERRPARHRRSPRAVAVTFGVRGA
jgi:rhodanese-related sulfurtransferase